jgi:hypothetical protein
VKIQFGRAWSVCGDGGEASESEKGDNIKIKKGTNQKSERNKSERKKERRFK